MQDGEHEGIVANMAALQSQLIAVGDALRLNRDKVGKLECLLIIGHHFNVSDISRRCQALHAALSAEGLLAQPLLRVVTRDGHKYSIIISRIDKLVTGEYETIENILSNMDIDKAAMLENNLELLENRLLTNSVELYDSLATPAKMSPLGKKFSGLITSKKRKYLYHYSPDKKRVLGFVGLRK
jgi:hypothetical protein